MGGNNQTATVRRVTGTDAVGIDGNGDFVVENAPVSLGSDPSIVASDGYRFFAGWRSDPFFFDVGGARNDLTFTGDDYFADKDVCSIVLEIPNNTLGVPRRGQPVAPLAGAARRPRVGLGPGRPWRAYAASGVPPRGCVGGLSRRRAG